MVIVGRGNNGWLHSISRSRHWSHWQSAGRDEKLENTMRPGNCLFPGLNPDIPCDIPYLADER